MQLAVFCLMEVRHGTGAYCGAGCGMPTDRSDRLAVHVFIPHHGRHHLVCQEYAEKHAPHLARLADRANERLTLLSKEQDETQDWMIVPVSRPVIAACE